MECRGKCLLVPVPIILSIIYNIPKFFELEATPRFDEKGNKNIHQSNETFYDDQYQINVTQVVEDIGYRGTALRLNHWYVVLYVFWSKFLLVEIFPWVIVIALNVCIWRKIKEFKRIRRETLRKDEGNKLRNYHYFKRCRINYCYQLLMIVVINFYFRGWSSRSENTYINSCCIRGLPMFYDSGWHLRGSNLYPTKCKTIHVHFKWSHRKHYWHCSFYAFSKLIGQLFTLCRSRQNISGCIDKGKRYQNALKLFHVYLLPFTLIRVNSYIIF